MGYRFNDQWSIGGGPMMIYTDSLSKACVNDFDGPDGRIKLEEDGVGFGWQAGAALLLTWALIALSMIDVDHQLLPDSITLPFLWLGLTLSLFPVFADMRSSLIGAIAGYLSLWTIYQVFRLLTGKEGMGFGDFKLLALLGAWMGWQSLPMIVLLSSAVGAVLGISMILIQGRDRHQPIPFGPYLAVAGWITLLWGEQISSSYLRWSGMAG